MTAVEKLSYSSLSTWLMCPRAWKYRYLDKVETPTNHAALFGTVTHRTVEAIARANSAGEKPDVLTLWTQSWNQVLEDEQRVDWGEETPEALFNEGASLVTSPSIRSYLSGLKVRDEALEKFVKFQVPGVPVPVVGFIDMIGDDGVPVDFKTSGKSWGKDRAQGELQPVFYLTALDQQGDTDHGYRFRHVVFVRTKKPYVQEFNSQFRQLDCLWLLSFIQQVWRGIEHEVFPPNPTTWKCSPGLCDYWRLCRW